MAHHGSNQAPVDAERLGDLVSIIGRRDFVSVPEAALIIGRHPQTIRLLVKAGHIQSFKIGTRTHISLQECDRFKQEGNYYHDHD